MKINVFADVSLVMIPYEVFGPISGSQV